MIHKLSAPKDIARPGQILTMAPPAVPPIITLAAIRLRRSIHAIPDGPDSYVRCVRLPGSLATKVQTEAQQ